MNQNIERIPWMEGNLVISASERRVVESDVYMSIQRGRIKFFAGLMPDTRSNIAKAIDVTKHFERITVPLIDAVIKEMMK